MLRNPSRIAFHYLSVHDSFHLRTSPSPSISLITRAASLPPGGRLAPGTSTIITMLMMMVISTGETMEGAAFYVAGLSLPVIYC